MYNERIRMNKMRVKYIVLVMSFLIMAASLSGCVSKTPDNIEQKTRSNEVVVTMLDVTNLKLEDAMDSLSKAGFTNVSITYDFSGISEKDNVFVVAQNVKAGDAISPDTQVILSCKKAIKLYVDIKSETNLLFNLYPMDIIIDGYIVGTVENGKTFTGLYDILNGEHVLTMYKSNDHSINSKITFSVEDDSTISATVSHGGSISINDFSVAAGINGNNIVISDVTHIVLSDAKEELESLGLVNIREEPAGDIWNSNNWIVISQGIEPGETVDKNVEVILDCIKLDDYFNQIFSGKTIKEAREVAKEGGFAIRFVDADNLGKVDDSILDTSEEEQYLWSIEKADQYIGKTATLYVKYHGKNEPEPNNIESTNEESTNDRPSSKGFKNAYPTPSRDKIFDNSYLVNLKAADVYADILTHGSVSYKDSFGDSEWYTFQADIDKISVSIFSIGRGGSPVVIRAMDIMKTGETHIYNDLINEVFTGKEANEATTWVQKHIYQEAETKFGDTNVVLRLTVSNYPILYILDDNYLGDIGEPLYGSLAEELEKAYNASNGVMDILTFKKTLISSLSSEYSGANCDAFVCDHTVVINIVKNDGYKVAQKAREEDQFLPLWQGEIKRFEKLSREYKEYLDQYGLSDYDLLIQWLNDENHDYVLAVFQNGEAIKDFINNVK